MKKFWIPVIASVLALGVSVTSFAAQWKTTYEDQLTDDMKATITSIEDLGDNFLASTNAAPESPNSAEELANVTDGLDNTYWTASAAGDSIQINFDGLELINQVHIYENGSSVGDFTIEAWNGVKWVEVYSNSSIRNYRVCAIDTITTNAIRVTINAFRNNATSVQLGEINAVYQAPVSTDYEFVNAGYMGKNSYLMRWETVPSGVMKSLDDLIMIEIFNWVRVDPTTTTETADDGFEMGDFVLMQPSAGGPIDHYTDPFGEEGTALMQKAAITLGSMLAGLDVNQNSKAEDLLTYEQAVEVLMSDEAPRLWICLTGGDVAKSNGDAASHQMFNDPNTLKKFVESVLEFVDLYPWIYGIDVDWEYPQTAKQYDAMASMFEQFHTAMAERGGEFSAAVSPSEASNMKSRGMWDNIDRLNIMSYMSVQDETHHSFQQMINHIDTYVAASCPTNKIVVGVPYYVINSNGNITDSHNAAFDSIYARYQLLNWDGEESGEEFVFPRGINAYSDGSAIVVFNGQNTLRDKVAYCVQRGVKGIFNWQQFNDINAYYVDEQVTAKDGSVHFGKHSLAREVREAIDQYVINP